MADTTFTRSQLVTRVLQKHRVIGEGQPASEEQRAIVDGIIDPGIDELSRRDIISIDPDIDMPVAYKEHLADFLKYFCATDFGRPADLTEKKSAEIQLRAIEADGPTFEPMKVDYMMRGGEQRFKDYTTE